MNSYIGVAFMKCLMNLDYLFSEKLRMVKTVFKRGFPEEYPHILKWKLQILYWDSLSWKEVCRVDNYLHEGKCQTHIHRTDTKNVFWKELELHEAEIYVQQLGKELIKKYFGEQL